jgi:hypothetical protein
MTCCPSEEERHTCRGYGKARPRPSGQPSDEQSAAEDTRNQALRVSDILVALTLLARIPVALSSLGLLSRLPRC